MKNVPPSVRAALKRRGADQILEQEGEYQQFKPQIDQILHADDSANIVRADYDEEYDNDLSPAEQKANDRIEELGSKYNKGKQSSLAQKQALDLLQVSSSEFNDPDKIQLEKSPKGNWIIHYDGKDTGMIVGADKINEEDAFENGMIIDRELEDDNKYEDLKEDLYDNEYLYGHLSKDEAAQVMAERKGISLDEAKDFMNKHFDNAWDDFDSDSKDIDARPNESKLRDMNLTDSEMWNMAYQYIGKDKLDKLAEQLDLESSQDIPTDELIKYMSDSDIEDMMRLNGLDDFDEEDNNLDLNDRKTRDELTEVAKNLDEDKISKMNQEREDKIEEMRQNYHSNDSKENTSNKKIPASVRKLEDLINGKTGSREGYELLPDKNLIKIGDSTFRMTKEQYRKLKELGYEDSGNGDYSYGNKDVSNKLNNRFSKEPNIKDYDINDELKNKLRDYEYYNNIEDINKALESEKEWKSKMQNERFRTQNDFDIIDNDIALLSDPRIQKYVNDRNAFNKQFETDYEEYKPIAKQAIIAKLLGNEDLYDIRSNNNRTNDLYDQVNSDFAKKYGYEDTQYNDMFKPGKRGFDNFLGDAEKITMQDGSRAYRRKLNKDKYLADLLDQGEITLADLRRLLK